MKELIFVILLLVSVSNGQDWLSHLNENLQRMNEDIRRNVNGLTRQIQQNVEKQVADITENIPNNSYVINGNSGQVLVGNGQSISNSNGVTQITSSGYTSDGTPYVRKVEEKVVGNNLHHKETISNPTTKQIQSFEYIVNLSDYTQKPRLITP